ncbi:MAG: hypothetical protein ACI4S2_14360 [Lachnospiraceae bacterium]
MKDEILFFLKGLFSYKDCMLIAAVDDNATTGIDTDICTELQNLGFGMQDEKGCSYVGIVKNFVNFFEEKSKSIIIYYKKIGQVEVKLMSAGFESGFFKSKIVINGESINIQRHRGITIAVVNCEDGIILDWVTMDLFCGKNEIICRKGEN